MLYTSYIFVVHILPVDPPSWAVSSRAFDVGEESVVQQAKTMLPHRADQQSDLCTARKHEPAEKSGVTSSDLRLRTRTNNALYFPDQRWYVRKHCRSIVGGQTRMRKGCRPKAVGCECAAATVSSVKLCTYACMQHRSVQLDALRCDPWYSVRQKGRPTGVGGVWAVPCNLASSMQ